MNDSIQYQTALRYAEMGWAIVPLYWPQRGVCSCREAEHCGSPGKHPLTKNGVHDASTDADVIRGWFKDWPRANIAIACGERSGLLVFDVDTRNGGEQRLQTFIDRYGLIPATPKVATGGGGWHYYFGYEGAAFPKDWGNGLDLLGDGRMAVAPYSEHVSGRRYRWEVPPW